MRSYEERFEYLNYAVEQLVSKEDLDQLRKLTAQRLALDKEIEERINKLDDELFNLKDDHEQEKKQLRAELTEVYKSIPTKYSPVLIAYEQIINRYNNAYIDSVRGDKERVLADAIASMEADSHNFLDPHSYEDTTAKTCIAYLHPEARRYTYEQNPFEPSEYLPDAEYMMSGNRLYDNERNLYSLLNGLSIFQVIYDLEGWDKADLEKLAYNNMPYLVNTKEEIQPNVDKEAYKEYIGEIPNISLEGYYKYSTNTLGRIPKPRSDAKLGDYYNVTLEGWDDEETTEEVATPEALYFRILTAYTDYRNAAAAVLSITGLEVITRNSNFFASAAPALEAFANVTFLVPTAGSKKGKTTITQGAKGTTKITFENKDLRIERTVKDAVKKNGILTLKLLQVISTLYLENHKREIVFDYFEFERLCYGNNTTNKSTDKSRRRDFRAAMLSLSECNLKLTGVTQPLDAKMQYIGDYSLSPSGEVHIDIGLNYARSLDTKRIFTYYPKELLKIDNSDANAYLLAQYLCRNYYRNDRQLQGRNKRLSVKAIMSEGIFTTIQALEEKKAARDWERRIKDPFENTLENLTFKYEILSQTAQWHYVLKDASGNYKPLPDDMSISNYRTFESLAIEFEMEHPQEKGESLTKYAGKVEERKQAKDETRTQKAGEKKASKKKKSSRG